MKKLTKQLNHSVLWAYNIARTNGLKGLFKAFIEFIYLNRECYVLFFDLGKKIECPEHDSSIKIINSDFKLLNEIRKNHSNLPPEFYFDRIDGCDKFFMLLIQNESSIEPATIGWAYDNNLPNKVFELSFDEIEFKHGITLKKFRGKNMFTLQTYYLLKDAQERGYRSVINLIESQNEISLRVHKKIGFKIIATWNFRKIFGFRISKKFSTSSLNFDNKHS